jgi:hypothetical protein
MDQKKARARANDLRGEADRVEFALAEPDLSPRPAGSTPETLGVGLPGGE